MKEFALEIDTFMKHLLIMKINRGLDKAYDFMQDEMNRIYEKFKTTRPLEADYILSMMRESQLRKEAAGFENCYTHTVSSLAYLKNNCMLKLEVIRLREEGMDV